MKRILILIIGLIISVASLYFALQGFDLGKLADALSGVRVGFFLLMIVPYVLTFMTKVWRWRILFHPDEERVSIGLLFSALMISYIPLPFRAGEVARGVVASARSGIAAPRVFSTIVVEKVLDVLTLLLLLGVSLPFVGLPSQLQSSALVVATGILAISVALGTLVARPNLARRLVGAIATRLPARLGPAIETATGQVLEGLAPLSNRPLAVRLGLWSLATWGVNAATIYLLLLAFNLQVTPMAAVALVVATNLGMAVPSAPGYIGTFELVAVTVLTALNQPLDVAQTFAVVYHFVGLVPVALIGVIAAIQQGAGMALFRVAGNASTGKAGVPVNPTAAARPSPAVRDKH